MTFKSKNTLISRDTKPSPSEPSYSSMTSYGRDGIRNMVRACLLRDRDIKNVIRQVQRDFGYSEEVLALTKHFFKFEIA